MSYSPQQNRFSYLDDLMEPDTSASTTPSGNRDFSYLDDLMEPDTSSPLSSPASSMSNPSAPIPVPEQPRGWSGIDTAKTFAGAMVDSTLNMLPFVNPMIVTDYEAAPAPTGGGAFGRAVDVGQDLASGLGEGVAGFMTAGIPGAAIAGAGSTLLRNLEEKEIDRIRELQRENPELGTRAASAQAAFEVQPDTGDYIEAAIAAPIAGFGAKMGIDAAKRIGGQFLTPGNVARATAPMLGYDVATGALQGAASEINRANAMPSEWLETISNPDALGRIATDAALSGLVSGGAQGLEVGSAMLRGWNPDMTPARRQAIERGLEVDANIQQGDQWASDFANEQQAAREALTAGNARSRQEIADTEARAAEMRDFLTEEQAAVQQAQVDQLGRDYERDRVPVLEQQEQAYNANRYLVDQESRGSAEVAGWNAEDTASHPANFPPQFNRDQHRYLLEASMRGIPESRALSELGLPPLPNYRAVQALAQSGVNSVGQAKGVLDSAGIRLSNDDIREALGNSILMREGVGMPAIAGDQSRSGFESRRFEDPRDVAQREFELLTQQTQGRANQNPEPLMLPQPYGSTTGEFPGRMVDVAPSQAQPDPNAPRMPGRPVESDFVGGERVSLPNGNEVLVPSQTARQPDLESQRMDARPGSRMIGESSAMEAPLPELGTGVPARNNVPSGDRIYEGVNRGEQQVTAATQPQTIETTAYPEGLDQLRARGEALRDPETGDLPRRVNSVNALRQAGNDEDMQNILAGMADTDKEYIDYLKMRDDGVLERADKIDRYLDPKNVQSIDKDTNLSGAHVLSLANATAGRLETARANPTRENLQLASEYLSKYALMASNKGADLNALKLARKAIFENLPPVERAKTAAAESWATWRKDGAPMPQKYLDRFDKIKDPNSTPEAFEVLRSIVREHKGWRNAIGHYGYSNMLFSPVTLGYNITSGGVNIAKSIPSNMLTQVADRAGYGKSSSTAPIIGEAKAELAGLLAGAKDGWTRMLHVMSNGYKLSEMADMDIRNMSTEMRGGAANPFNWPQRALSMTDELVRGTMESMERSRLSFRKAYMEGQSEGLSGQELNDYVANNFERFMVGDRAIENAAKDVATRGVHQDKAFINRLGFDQKLPRGVVIALEEASSLLVPFHRSIMSLSKAGAQYTPLGFTAPAFKDMPREAKARSVARATMGTLAGAGIYLYALEGNVTAEAPTDPREREMFYALGKQPYSIKIGDTWIDYRTLGALYYPIAGVASLAQAAQKHKEDPTSNRFFNSLSGVFKSFSEVPTMAGVSTLMDAITSEKKGVNFAANLTSRFVPGSSLQRFTNRVGLTSDRVPDANTYGERVLGGTVLSDTIPGRLDSFGREIERPGYFGDASDRDPVFSEMDRLGIKPMSSPTSMVVRGENVTLTPEQKREILSSGKPAYQRIHDFIQSDRYANIPEEYKAVVLEDMYRKQLQSARSRGQSGVRREEVSRRVIQN